MTILKVILNYWSQAHNGPCEIILPTTENIGCLLSRVRAILGDNQRLVGARSTESSPCENIKVLLELFSAKKRN